MWVFFPIINGIHFYYKIILYVYSIYINKPQNKNERKARKRRKQKIEKEIKIQKKNRRRIQITGQRE